MHHYFKHFLESLWTQRCLSCRENSSLEAFCFYCEPFVEKLEQDAIYAYTGPVREIIQQAKFQRNETKARRLVESAVDSINANLRRDDKSSTLEGITFVPVHWRRRLSRGFDLSAIFALALSKKLQIPVYDLLINKRFDAPLTLASSREERLNLTKNRYKLAPSKALNWGRIPGQARDDKSRYSPAKKLLLVDDVWTTGATLDSAKRVLEQAGHQVSCLALAKTPAKLHKLRQNMEYVPEIT